MAVMVLVFVCNINILSGVGYVFSILVMSEAYSLRLVSAEWERCTNFRL